ncbi:MAG TPA: hypothetical protein VGP72_33695 [Planctomycetota bacterium]
MDPTSRWLAIAQGLLLQPTAACKEECPAAFVRHFAEERSALAFSADPSGNLLVKYGGSHGQSAAQKDARQPARATPLVFVAHMDHPGFWIEKATGRGGAGVPAGHVELTFKGWVGKGHTHRGEWVEFFAPGKPCAVGAGELVSIREEKGRLVGARAKIKSGVAPEGGFAMWAFPAFSIEKCNGGAGLRAGKIVARGCDDQLGCATMLCLLDELARRKPKGVQVWALFTRAEEVGFFGTLEAIRHKVLPKNALVISIETSKAGPIAAQGDGVVVRVGDKASIFDPGLTAALCQAAASAAKKIPGFKFQRKLMDGGTCEATAYCSFGWRASGLAMPLGNYHNQAEANGKLSIGPENIAVDDFRSTVQLLVELALHPEMLKPGQSQLPAWMKERGKAAREALTGSGEVRRPKREI